MKPTNLSLFLISCVCLATFAVATAYGHGEVIVGKVVNFGQEINTMETGDCAACHLSSVKLQEKHLTDQLVEGDACGACHNQ